MLAVFGSRYTLPNQLKTHLQQNAIARPSMNAFENLTMAANETRRSTRAKDFCNVVWKVQDNGRIGSSAR